MESRMNVQESPFKGKTGARRLWNAFFYSLAGLKAAYKHEDAFRQEVLLAVILIPTAFFLTPNNLARAAMIASVFLLLIVELVNSAIEATVDRISLENHKLAKRAKDIGSASVLMAIVNLLAVWVLAMLA